MVNIVIAEEKTISSRLCSEVVICDNEASFEHEHSLWLGLPTPKLLFLPLHSEYDCKLSRLTKLHDISTWGQWSLSPLQEPEIIELRFRIRACGRQQTSVCQGNCIETDKFPIQLCAWEKERREECESMAASCIHASLKFNYGLL